MVYKYLFILFLPLSGMLSAQTDFSLRSAEHGYFIGGLSAVAGAHVGIKINTSNKSAVYGTYGTIPFQDLFRVKATIISIGYNHFKNPELSSSGFANIALSYGSGQSTDDQRKESVLMISPNLGFDYLVNNASVFVKLGLIGAVSNNSKPKSTINIEFGFTTQLW